MKKQDAAGLVAAATPRTRPPREIIVTSRLVLRSPLPSDWQPLHEYVLSDPEVMKLAFAGQPMSPEQAKEFFDRNFDHEASGRKIGVLAERATAEVIGFAGLLRCDVLGGPDYELGYVLRQSAWGKGFATEIGRGQIDYGLNALGLKRLLALVSPKNTASIAVLAKIGMKFHSTVQNDQRGERQVYVTGTDR